MLSTPNNDRDLKRFEAITLNTTKKVSRHPINQVCMHKPTKNTVSQTLRALCLNSIR